MSQRRESLAELPEDILERIMSHLCETGQQPHIFPGNSHIRSLSQVCKAIKEKYQTGIVTHIFVDAQLRTVEEVGPYREFICGALHRFTMATSITVANIGRVAEDVIPWNSPVNSLTDVSHTYVDMIEHENRYPTLCELVLRGLSVDDTPRVDTLKFTFDVEEYDHYMRVNHRCSPSCEGDMGNSIWWIPEDSSEWLARLPYIKHLEGHSFLWDISQQSTFFGKILKASSGLKQNLETVTFYDCSLIAIEVLEGNQEGSLELDTWPKTLDDVFYVLNELPSLSLLNFHLSDPDLVRADDFLERARLQVQRVIEYAGYTGVLKTSINRASAERSHRQ